MNLDEKALDALLERLDARLGDIYSDAARAIRELRAERELAQEKPFGYWDHFNEVLYRGDDAGIAAGVSAAEGGNKITPLFTRPAAQPVPQGMVEPTIQELQQQIGNLTRQLELRVCGDPTKGFMMPAAAAKGTPT